MIMEAYVRGLENEVYKLVEEIKKLNAELEAVKHDRDRLVAENQQRRMEMERCS